MRMVFNIVASRVKWLQYWLSDEYLSFWVGSLFDALSQVGSIGRSIVDVGTTWHSIFFRPVSRQIGGILFYSAGPAGSFSITRTLTHVHTHTLSLSFSSQCLASLSHLWTQKATHNFKICLAGICNFFLKNSGQIFFCHWRRSDQNYFDSEWTCSVFRFRHNLPGVSAGNAVLI